MGKALIAWSGGKDSAWTLQRLRGSPGTEVAGLFTAVEEDTGRVAVHAVPRSLLEAQARAAGLPLHRIAIPRPCPNAVYEAAVAKFVEGAVRDGVTQLAFGDLFLEDIRRYRERQFAQSGVDLARAPRAWAGRSFDGDFLKQVPDTVDPCGERGEFHTFAFAGPMFRAPLSTRTGAVTERDGFAYAEVASG
jgi:diphthamide synthase (EF-2-diphthine--ammonia ligase)